MDLALTCDTTLGPVLQQLADAYRARTSVRVSVFPTGPGLILPQLLRDIQNDILVTQTTILDQALRSNIIARAVAPQWRNPLVIAGRNGTPSRMDGSFAAPDPTPMSDIDGPALLRRLAISPPRTVGAVDTDEVAFLLQSGAAQAGLVHMTDVRANSGFTVIRSVDESLSYAASVTRLANRPNPEGFV